MHVGWMAAFTVNLWFCCNVPDSKVHGANMGPTWVLSAQMGPMLAPWTLLSGVCFGLVFVFKDSFNFHLIMFFLCLLKKISGFLVSYSTWTLHNCLRLMIYIKKTVNIAYIKLFQDYRSFFRTHKHSNGVFKWKTAINLWQKTCLYDE